MNAKKQEMLTKIVENARSIGKETEQFDFKQEWHNEMKDLIKDIVCFTNTVHNQDCYIIIGISDNLELIGVKERRITQNDILDALSNLSFAEGNYPKIEVDVLDYMGVELDILTIFNNDKTPLYLLKPYGDMFTGCIYTRVKDRNTPNKSNADISEIENLWKKRLGLTRSVLDRIIDSLSDKLEWERNREGFYNIYNPLYTIVEDEYDDSYIDEFYCYAVCNSSCHYYDLYIKCNNTVLDTYQMVVLDSGRLCVPTPKWGFIHFVGQSRLHAKYSYKYYIKTDPDFKLLEFYYDPNNSDHRYAFIEYQEVILIFEDENEQHLFEGYLNNNESLVENEIKKTDRYYDVSAADKNVQERYLSYLRTGFALNTILSKWRSEQNNIKC